MRNFRTETSIIVYTIVSCWHTVMLYARARGRRYSGVMPFADIDYNVWHSYISQRAGFKTLSEMDFVEGLADCLFARPASALLF
jgi:hypothetical protein